MFNQWACSYSRSRSRSRLLGIYISNILSKSTGDNQYITKSSKRSCVWKEQNRTVDFESPSFRGLVLEKCRCTSAKCSESETLTLVGAAAYLLQYLSYSSIRMSIIIIYYATLPPRLSLYINGRLRVNSHGPRRSSSCTVSWSLSRDAFYAFYAWWVYFPQLGALAEQHEGLPIGLLGLVVHFPLGCVAKINTPWPWPWGLTHRP